MMNKDILIAIGAGSLSAVAALTYQSGASGGFLFVHFAPLPLMLVGLSLGAVTGTIAAIAGVITAALLGGLLASALFAVLLAFPAWFMTRQALLKQPTQNGGEEWYPIGSIVSLLALMAAFMFVMVGIAEWNNAEEYQRALSKRLDLSLGIMFPSIPDVQRTPIVELFTAILPALIGAYWIFIAVINGILAESVLVKIDKNIRPRPVYSAMSLPEWHSWVAVAAACLAVIGSGKVDYMGHTLVTILAVPFFFNGLAVVHSLARHLAFPGLLIAAVYFSIFLSLWAALVVAAIGVTEQWFGLRHRLPAQAPNQEE
ncbi:MAG: DUF2232 domain-containing protein [Rhodospirillales bacterium]